MTMMVLRLYCFIIGCWASTVHCWWGLKKVQRSAVVRIPDEVLLSRDRTLLSPFMDDMVAAVEPTSLSIVPEDLYGAWRVCCTRPGPKGEPNWVKYSKALGQGRNNNDYQIFSLDGSFVNLSEYASANFFATASGKYDLNPPGSIPQVTATVDSVSIHLINRSVKLGVTGTGFVTVRYLDATNGFRVFENEDGAQVLQQRVDLPKIYGRFLQ